MGDVIDFAGRTEAGYDGQLCPACGGTWFTVQAVALTREGSINAHMAPVTCHSCGHVLVAGPWARPELTDASQEGGHG